VRAQSLAEIVRLWIELLPEYWRINSATGRWQFDSRRIHPLG
jgi:hypothetical protein